MTDLPAIVGGTLVFETQLPFARPTLDDRLRVEEVIAFAEQRLAHRGTFGVRCCARSRVIGLDR